MGARAQNGRTPLGHMSGPVGRQGLSRRPRVLRRWGKRDHSRIVPVERRISTLSTSCGSGIGRTEDDDNGSGWRWGTGSGNGQVPHLGPKLKATPSANHVLQERQT